MTSQKQTDMAGEMMAAKRVSCDASLQISEGRVLEDEEGEVSEDVGLVPEEGGVPLTGVVGVEADAEQGEEGEGVALGRAPPRDGGDVVVLDGVHAEQGGKEEEAQPEDLVRLGGSHHILVKPLVT